MTQAYDAIIIGGGIMGGSTALELARRGLSVAVLEKDQIGQGPSGQSSAIVRQHYSNELTARMALYSLNVFKEFADAVGGECGFTKVGCLFLVAARDRAGLAANVDMQRRVGIDTRVVSPEEMRELMPGLDVTDAVAAAFEPESGYADPYATVTAYAVAARRYGAVVLQETPVTAVTFREDAVTGVDTPAGHLAAPVVINCAGAWGARVATMAGLDVPINACRVQVAFFRRPAGEEASHPVVGDFIQASYFRAETGQLTLAGRIDPGEAKAIVDPDHFDQGMDTDFLLDVGDRLVARYPAMARSQSTGGYASLYAITPDWHPIVDEMPVGSGFYICSGFSGHGFKLGPAVGLMMADMITGTSTPMFDPHLFRFARFAADEPVRGQYEYSIVG